MVMSHWTAKDGAEGLALVGILSGAARDLEVKDVDLCLSTQIQMSQGILGIFLWDCVALPWDYKPTQGFLLWFTLGGWVHSHIEMKCTVTASKNVFMTRVFLRRHCIFANTQWCDSHKKQLRIVVMFDCVLFFFQVSFSSSISTRLHLEPVTNSCIACSAGFSYTAPVSLHVRHASHFISPFMSKSRMLWKLWRELPRTAVKD